MTAKPNPVKKNFSDKLSRVGPPRTGCRVGLRSPKG